MRFSISILSLVSFILFGCASATKKQLDDSINPSNRLIGRWELIKEYYEGEEIFDLTETSKMTDKAWMESFKNNYLQFKEGGKVSARVWTTGYELSTPIEEDEGIYEMDVPTGRVALQIEHNNKPNSHSGSFLWKVKGNLLYLYSTNHRTGTYRVYRRSK